MPGEHYTDDALRKAVNGQSDKEKIDGILSFLFQLSDQLRYIFEQSGTAETISRRRQGEVSIELSPGERYCFRKSGIYFISAEKEEKLV